MGLSIGVFLLPSCIYSTWDNGISGDGNVKTEQFDIKGFTGVHVSSGIDAEVSQGEFFVELEADGNLHEYITVEREGDMLVIGSERNIRRAESKLVRVSLPELDELRISSAGDIEGKTDFECDDLEISISSAGDLDIGVNARLIDISISSSGDCDIYGETEKLKARLSSAGDLEACDLKAEVVDVKVSSAGDACVMATKEIEMEASSAGSIYYYGDPTVVRSHASSAGSIIHKGKD